MGLESKDWFFHDKKNINKFNEKHFFPIILIKIIFFYIYFHLILLLCSDFPIFFLFISFNLFEWVVQVNLGKNSDLWVLSLYFNVILRDLQIRFLGKFSIWFGFWSGGFHWRFELRYRFARIYSEKLRFRVMEFWNNYNLQKKAILKYQSKKFKSTSKLLSYRL